MRKGMIAVFGCMILININVKAQWEEQYVLNDFTISSLRFIDENRGWSMMGEYPMHTQNGGQTWSVYMEEGNQTTDIFCLNQDTAFIVGLNLQNGFSYNFIAKSIDGGLTWQRKYNLQGFSQIRGLFFVDNLHGWARIEVLPRYKLIRTIDGGESWTELNLPDSTYSGDLKFQFISSLVGWRLHKSTYNSNQQISKTTDGGSSFNTQYTTSMYVKITEMFFYSHGTKGWMLGTMFNNPLLMHSIDGGETWTTKEIAPLMDPNGNTVQARRFTNINFANDSLGWLSCEYSTYGFILVTLDGGASWQQQLCYVKSNTNEQINRICFVNNKKAWAATNNRIFHNENADEPIQSFVLSTPQISKGKLATFPNPFVDFLMIENYDNNIPTSVTITTMTGQLCFKKERLSGNMLNLSFLDSGVYVITIVYSVDRTAKSISHKIVKL